MENQNFNGAPMQQGYQQPQPQYQQPQLQYQQPPFQQVINDSELFHTGIGGWIGWLLLSAILPFLGLIIALCAAKDKSVKNWAAAQLVVMLIGIVLCILLVVVCGVSLGTLVDSGSY